MEVNSNWTDSVFEGTADLPAEEQFPHLLEEGLAGAEHVTLDLFRHLAALVTCQSQPLFHHSLHRALPQSPKTLTTLPMTVQPC